MGKQMPFGNPDLVLKLHPRGKTGTAVLYKGQKLDFVKKAEVIVDAGIPVLRLELYCFSVEMLPDSFQNLDPSFPGGD